MWEPEATLREDVPEMVAEISIDIVRRCHGAMQRTCERERQAANMLVELKKSHY
jgi:hypothetical protein